MGISNFERFLKAVQKMFIDVKKFTPPDDIETLWIDGNAVIYRGLAMVIKSDPAYQSISPQVFERLVIEKSIQIIEFIRVLHKPQQSFGIFFDGVVPDAKANQQKQRRHVRAMEKSEAIMKNTDRTADEESLLAPFDTAVISPGTSFMEKMMRSVKEYLGSYDVVQGTKETPAAKRQFLSTDLAPGEGEHKMIDMIRKGFIRNTGNHVIVGADSDLIVLMAAQKLDNVYVYRDSEHANYWVNINLIKYYLNDVWGDSLLDFLLVIAYMGNDFIPSPIAFMKSADRDFNAVDELIEAYKETIGPNKEYIVVDGEINLDRHLLFQHNLAKREMKMIEKVAPNRQNSPIFEHNLSYVSHNYVSKSEKDLSGVKFNGEDNYLQFVEEWREQEKNLNQNIPDIKTYSNADVGLDSGIEFLMGVYWTFSYYTTGSSSNSWVYRYVYAPMLKDIDLLPLVKGDPELKQEIIDSIKETIAPVPAAPLMEISQLLFSIIPENTTHGAPAAIMTDIISEAERRKNFVPTIDYYGLDKADSHVHAINLPAISRKFEKSTRRWILAGVKPSVNEHLFQVAQNYIAEKTMFTERKESAINLASTEKTKYDEEVARYKLQWKGGDSKTASEATSSAPVASSSGSSTPRTTTAPPATRRTTRVAGVPKGAAVKR